HREVLAFNVRRADMLSVRLASDRLALATLDVAGAVATGRNAWFRPVDFHKLGIVHFASESVFHRIKISLQSVGRSLLIKCTFPLSGDIDESSNLPQRHLRHIERGSRPAQLLRIGLQ